MPDDFSDFAEAAIPRRSRALVVEALADTRVVLIAGARQVGKSTLAAAVAEHDHPARLLSLDDKATRDAAIGDPAAFVAGLDGPVVIDEVQRAPDLLLAIKRAVDDDTTPGRFLLTGSASILSAPRIAESLAGRVEIVDLWPLAQSEIGRSGANIVDALYSGRAPVVAGATVGRAAFVDRAVRGGFPEALRRDTRRRDRWFNDYVRGIVERDLRDLSGAQKLEHVPRLLRLLAAQSAGIFRADRIGRAIGLDMKTVQSYTRLLETVFLVAQAPAWRPSIGSREVQAPKVYIRDSGLLAHLLGADAARAASDDQVSGRLFESFVAMEVARHLPWATTSARLHHYRDRDDEVDIVLESRSGAVACIECKAGATVGRADHRAIGRLRDALGERFVAGFVVYTGADTIPLGDRVWAVPVSALWAEL